MAFPVWLTANLGLGLAVRALGAKRNDPLIFEFVTDGNSPSLAAIQSPIVWIGGGTEPLEQPKIPSLANALASGGRYVFLQTNGQLLRRRVHELRPVPRLFLTVRFDVGETPDGSRADQAGVCGLAREGIRTARLSGFLICAQMILHAERDVGGLSQLHAQLRSLDLDGFLISAATSAEDVQHAVAEARQRLLGHRWALLSRLLDSVMMPASAPLGEASFALPASLVQAASPSEENAQVQ